MKTWLRCRDITECRDLERSSPGQVMAHLVLNHKDRVRKYFGPEYPGHLLDVTAQEQIVFLIAEEELRQPRTDEEIQQVRDDAERYFHWFQQTAGELSSAVCVRFERDMLPEELLPAYA